MALSVCERLRTPGTSGRTVTLKVRYPDFTTVTRSATYPGPTDDTRLVARAATRLLADIDLARGVRLLGVGVSGLTPWVQDDLFEAGSPAVRSPAPSTSQSPTPQPPIGPPRWRPGQDVVHERLGQGWVWGTGLGRVTVRFETRDGPPGPVHTLDAADPLLAPLSLVDAPRLRPDADQPPHPPVR
jgi:DNA polymerase-4